MKHALGLNTVQRNLPLPLYDQVDAHDSAKRNFGRSSSRASKVLVCVSLWAALTFLYVSSRSSWTERPTSVHTCGSPSCERNPAWLVRAKHGAVASENELCSELGVDTLRKGGNAVDAAVSTTLCVGVLNMFSCVAFSASCSRG